MSVRVFFVYNTVCDISEVHVYHPVHVIPVYLYCICLDKNMFRISFLHLGGYVMFGVCLSVQLSVCLSVCLSVRNFT